MGRDPRRGRRRHRTTGGALRRLLGLLAFLPVASRAPTYARLIWELARDDRISIERKALLVAAAGYVMLGRDLVADDLPIVGGLDDLVVVVVAIDLFLDGVPADVMSEKIALLGIDRASFDEDLGRIRRLTPGPVRRTIRRAPEVIGVAAAAVERTGIGPRVRHWLAREDSIA